MLLQPQNPFISYASPLRSNIPAIALPRSSNAFSQKTPPAARCSISRPSDYSAMDFKRKHMVQWKDIYRKISLTKQLEIDAAVELNQIAAEGKILSKWELRKVVKELRKYKLYSKALEVCEWMSDRGDSFVLSPRDAAIQLDLVAKVHGVSSAEDFFGMLPKTLKDKRVYAALLNTYCRAGMKDNAESLMTIMRKKGFAREPLPFTVMMTLYMNLKEYEKVEALVSEMMLNNIYFDVCTYNIWLSSRGSQGCPDSMEEVFEQMKLDRMVNPDWTTYCTMCATYIKMGLMEKAEQCLRRVESLITGRNWVPFHSLISLYAGIGKKDEIYRIWSTYTSIFPKIPDIGYRAVVCALIRVGDIEGAEKLYKQRQSPSRDPRLGNRLMYCYVKEGDMQKAEAILDYMLEVGAVPNTSTYSILAAGHIAEGRIKEALSCYEEALAIDGSRWRPKPSNVSALMDLCEDRGDTVSEERLVEMLGQSDFLKDKLLRSQYDVLVGSDDVDEFDDYEDDFGGYLVR